MRLRYWIWQAYYATSYRTVDRCGVIPYEILQKTSEKAISFEDPAKYRQMLPILEVIIVQVRVHKPGARGGLITACVPTERRYQYLVSKQGDRGEKTVITRLEARGFDVQQARSLGQLQISAL